MCLNKGPHKLVQLKSCLLSARTVNPKGEREKGKTGGEIYKGGSKEIKARRT